MTIKTVKDYQDNEVEPYWTDAIKWSNYNVPISASCKIHECLGKIRDRKDGRFDWWRKNSDFYKQWSGEAQGVADTFSEAKVAIEKGWLAGENHGDD